jgi:hypothetical protein
VTTDPTLDDDARPEPVLDPEVIADLEAGDDDEVRGGRPCYVGSCTLSNV